MQGRIGLTQDRHHKNENTTRNKKMVHNIVLATQDVLTVPF